MKKIKNMPKKESYMDSILECEIIWFVNGEVSTEEEFIKEFGIEVYLDLVRESSLV